MNPRVAIVSLNYNGKGLLEKYLPSLQRAVKYSKFSCELWVLDNCSSDGSTELIKQKFSYVKIFEAKENKVLCSYNDFAAASDHDILIFMNNDIDVEERFVDPLVEPFLNDDTIFFVTPKCFSMADRRYEGNKTKAGIRYGVFWATSVYPGHEKEIETPSRSFQGGFGALDRKKFLTLGGYDDLYLPGRLEDADICFRAQKRGWKVLYAPKSVVFHEGGTSFHKRFGIKKTLTVNWRNTFLFMRKNLTAPRFIWQFIFWMPLRLAYSVLTGRWEFAAGFWQSLFLMSEAAKRRKVLAAKGLMMGVSDEQIFKNSVSV